jgi:hypothetical protein
MEIIEVEIKTRRGDTFQATLNLHEDMPLVDGMVNVFGTEARCQYEEVQDVDGMKPVLGVLLRNLPADFKKIYKPKPNSFGQVFFRLQPSDAERIKAHRAAVKAALDQKRAEETARAEAEAASVIPLGLHYDFGCDCEDSVSIRFEESVPRLVQDAWERLNGDPAALVKKHLRGHEIRALAAELGAVETPSAPFSYGGYDFTGGQMMVVITRAREREEYEQLEKRQREQARQREQERITQAAQGREIIIVECESRPHKQDLSNAILNAPAPQGGSFLVGKRVDRALWERMKTAGAVYYDRETLEDFDMFDAEPGWRYDIAAIAELIAAGYAVRIDREVFITREALNAHFS